MRPDDLLALLRRQPFTPFRIHLTDGTAYEVRHPDQCIVTRSAVHVAIPSNGHSYASNVAYYSLIHINRLEPLLAEQTS